MYLKIACDMMLITVDHSLYSVDLYSVDHSLYSVDLYSVDLYSVNLYSVDHSLVDWYVDMTW